MLGGGSAANATIFKQFETKWEINWFSGAGGTFGEIAFHQKTIFKEPKLGAKNRKRECQRKTKLSEPIRQIWTLLLIWEIF